MRLERLDLLDTVLRTNQNRIWRFYHDQIIHSAKRDESSIGDGDILMSIMANDGSSDTISISVRHDMRWQRRPSPQIVPIEFGEHGQDLARIFHDGVIHRNLRQ